MLQTANDVSKLQEFDLADPNNLALAYMVIVEKSASDLGHFRRRAEADLVVNFMDLRKPMLDRLYQDLVVSPPPFTDQSGNPLAQMLRVWAKHGEVYRYWEASQTKTVATRGQRPDRRKGQWTEVPSEFWMEEDRAAMPMASKLTKRQAANIDAYNQRYREFYNLQPWQTVEFDPYLDFKIHMTLTNKLRDAGPVATIVSVKVILMGGSAQDVLNAIDAAAALDGLASAGPTRGSASAPNAMSRGGDGLEPSLPAESALKEPVMPMPPILMKPEYSRKIPPGERPLYRHTIHGGGLADILANQRMIATDSSQFAGRSSGVRAYNGPFKKPVTPGKYPHIEFHTKEKPNYRPFFGVPGSEWPMKEGEYLDIEIVSLIHADGTVEKYKGPPGEKKPSTTVPKLVLPNSPSNSPVTPPPANLPPRVTPDAPYAPKPQPHQAPAGRQITMREWMVLETLTGQYQVVSGIYLQCGIPDADLIPILDMLVREGYAEKQPDPQKAGLFMYRGSPQWIMYKSK